MAQQRRTDDKLIDKPRPNETSDIERERIRSSNDRDQAAERDGMGSRHNKGYDEAARGRSESMRGQNMDQDMDPMDPDSAMSEVDRDEGAE